MGNEKGFTNAWQIKDLFARYFRHSARSGGWERLCLDGFANANPSAPGTPSVGLLSQSGFALSSSFAFTLAEVLITLAIIGVVATLTIPSVVKNYRATELKTQFKKAFSIINQATARMNLEEGIIISKMSGSPFNSIFKKYVKMHKDGGAHNYVFTNNNIEKYRTYAKNLNIVPRWDLWDDGQLILENGMLIMIENAYSSPNPPTMISVDINGIEKRPNAWGHDVFTFQVMENGKIMPMGTAGTLYIDSNTYCSKTSTSNGNGIACAYYALTDEDYFKNLP